MSSTLTSWKEIANYLGKGVRTVQRWEAEGLPVRRPNARDHGIVSALPNELDAWLESRKGNSPAARPMPCPTVVLNCHEVIDANRNLRFRRGAIVSEMRKQRLRMASELERIVSLVATIRPPTP